MPGFRDALAIVIGATVVACGGSTSDAPMSDAGDDSPAVETSPAVDATCPADLSRPPKVHRPVADACPRDRPADMTEPVDGGTISLNQCRNDSDCWLLPNGRCVPELSYNVCTFDECFSDSDCAPNKTCTCRVPTQIVRGQPAPPRNTCRPSNCRTDADCGSGRFCALATYPSCGGFMDSGWFCTTDRDQCHSSDDCCGGNCGYDSVAGAWLCQQVGGCTG